MPLFRKREKETEKYCIKCGESLTQDASYCTKCGSSQESTQSESNKSEIAVDFEIADWRKAVAMKNDEYVVFESNPNTKDLWFGYHPEIMSDCGWVLTNQRLIVLGFKFGEQKDGKTPISFELQKEFPLETIKDVTYQDGKIAIYTDDAKYDRHGDLWEITGFRPKPYSEDTSYAKFNYFRAKIIEQKGKKASVTLDFSFLKSVMEKGGIVLTTLTCPKCNAPMKIPTDGTETVCEHCGSRVIAQDIFKKLKTLLS